MKQSFGEEGRVPRGTHPRSPWTEPTVVTPSLGSSVCFSAGGKYLTENASQPNTRSIAPDSAEHSRLGVFAPTRATLHQLVQIHRALGNLAPTRALSRGNP